MNWFIRRFFARARAMSAAVPLLTAGLIIVDDVDADAEALKPLGVLKIAAEADPVRMFGCRRVAAWANVAERPATLRSKTKRTSIGLPRRGCMVLDYPMGNLRRQVRNGF
jgi:hypothetical protein